jgi:hypothetical protein
MPSRRLGRQSAVRRSPSSWQADRVEELPLYPFHGAVHWLTPEEGGRRSGPPSATYEYRAVAYLLPNTFDEGLAGFALRGFEPGRWHSDAEGRWLIVNNEGPQRVEPGSILKICEGRRHVADFSVSAVDLVDVEPGSQRS